jgi:hypothetical protein
MTAIGTSWRAVLACDQRGPLLTFPAGTQREAFAHGQALFERARNFDWYRGEVVSVRVEQAEA